MKKIIIMTIVAGLMGVACHAVAQEADEFDILIGINDEVFSYTAPLAGQVTFRSPFRNANGTDRFAPVNSKYAQPRNTGSNPHIGVDLQPTNEGEAVYPVRAGMVYFVDRRTVIERGYGRVTIQFDVNGDGQYDLINDNLFVTYLHMRDIPDFEVCNDPLTRNETCDVAIDRVVWLASNVSPDQIAVHLHFEINTISGTSDCRDVFRLPGCTAVRTHRYYEGLSGTQWNGGRDLDFITDIAWMDSQRAEARVYAMNNGEAEDVREGYVILFHRRRGSAEWTRTSMNKNGNLFFLDLSGFYPSGTDLELYGRATRSAILRQPRSACDNDPTRYNYSFMKPRRHRPDPCDVDFQDIFHVLLVN